MFIRIIVKAENHTFRNFNALSMGFIYNHKEKHLINQPLEYQLSIFLFCAFGRHKSLRQSSLIRSSNTLKKSKL